MRCRRFGGLQLTGAALALACTPAPAGGGPSAKPVDGQYDWCAPVVVRPDQRWLSRKPCVPAWSVEDIAAGAEVVLMGTFNDVIDPPLPPFEHECFGPWSQDNLRAYVDSIRERAAERGQRPSIVHMHRFDLVSWQWAALPGFRAEFLLRTRLPWSQMKAFFTASSSSLCQAGSCRLSDSAGPGVEGKDHGKRLRELIDARGGPGRHRSAVYYLNRAQPGKRVHYTDAALANLDDPAYRAWRVKHAARLHAVGGYDAIMLNSKAHQYRPRRGRQPNRGHWIGSPDYPDMEALNQSRDTLWSAPPDGYGYPEYIRGWAALAGDLRGAGVPYAVIVSPFVWRKGADDDPATRDVDEAELIRGAARGARIVLLERRPQFKPVEFGRIVKDLESHGARVVPIDPRCGQRSPR